MILAGMYFALGALVAGLLAVAIMPAIWRRALRLTRARAEASVPLSRAEISADRDKLRATFAADNRKLELQADRLREQVADRVVEVNRERDVSAALRGEKARLTETVSGLETRVDDLTGKLATAEKGHADARAEVEAHQRALTEREKELTELGRKHREAEQLTDAQRLEQVALKTEIGNLRDELAKAETRFQEATTASAALKASLAAEALRLDQAQAEAATLRAEVRETEAAREGALAKADRAAGFALAAQMESVGRGLRLFGIEHLVDQTRASAATLDARMQENDAARNGAMAQADRAAGLALAARMESVGRSVRQKELERTLAATRTRRDELVSELALVSKDRTSRAEEVQRRAAELAAARNDLEGERRRAEKAVSTSAEVEAAFASLREELSSANDDRIDMLTTLDQQRSALEESRREHDATRARIADLEAGVERREKELAAARSSVEERDAELAGLRETLATGEAGLRDAVARVETESEARARAEKALEERQVEIDALNAEMLVLAGDAGPSPDDAKPDSARDGAAVPSGDNIRKSLAVAEETNTRLVAQITALEREARNLRLENDRLRQMTTADRKEADVSRKLERVGDAVARLSESVDTPEGDDVATIERAPLARAGEDEPAGQRRTLAERLRDLQQPSARS